MPQVMIKANGERTTAQYITTSSGNKRYSVDGKTYTDKQFDKLFVLLPNNSQTLLWKTHVRQLFEEILINKEMWILEKPLRILLHTIGSAAQHAAKIQDDKMIGFFCALAIYTFSDPTDKEYDEERTQYYLNKLNENQ